MVAPASRTGSGSSIVVVKAEELVKSQKKVYDIETDKSTDPAGRLPKGTFTDDEVKRRAADLLKNKKTRKNLDDLLRQAAYVIDNNAKAAESAAKKPFSLDGKIIVGGVKAGDFTSPTLFMALNPNGSIGDDDFGFYYSATAVFARGYSIGQGSVAVDQLFGPGAAGSLASGGLGFWEVEGGIGNGERYTNSATTKFTWRTMFGINENTYYPFDPLDLSAVKLKIPAEMRDGLGGRASLFSPVYANHLRFFAEAAIGAWISDLNLSGGGLKFGSHGSDNATTMMLDMGLTAFIYLDPVKTVESNVKIEKPFDGKNVIAVTYHGVKQFDGQQMSHSVDFGTRLLFGAVGVGADLRLNPQLVPNSAGVSDSSSFGGAAQVSYDFSSGQRVLVSGGLYKSTLTRIIDNSGAPSVGTPEPAVTSTYLGELGAGFAFNKYVSTRISFNSFPEGNGGMATLTGKF